MAARCLWCNSRRLTKAVVEPVSKWGRALWWVRWCRKCGEKNVEMYR